MTSFADSTSRGLTIDLSGRAALVTGAAAGIGRATVDVLVRCGANVVATDIQQQTLESLRATAPDSIDPIVADLSDLQELPRLIERAHRRWNRVDILVNNAGILFPTRFESMTNVEWSRTFDVNVTAPAVLSRLVAPLMRANGFGRIVNMSSTAGRSVSTLGGAHYTASKAALLGLTRASAKELAPHGITVNAVCPGLIDTEMARATVSDAELNVFASGFPIARLGRPEEVAAVIAFLSSDYAAYITGAAIDVNGGDLML